MPKITLPREKKTIECPVGANLREVLLANGIQVYRGISQKLNCGGHGRCATCRVYIKEGAETGASEPGAWERFRTALSMWMIGHEDEARLSCQTKVTGDMTVETVPEPNVYGDDVWKYTTKPPFGSEVGTG